MPSTPVVLWQMMQLAPSLPSPMPTPWKFSGLETAVKAPRVPWQVLQASGLMMVRRARAGIPPVVVEAGRQTSVHLEGGIYWPADVAQSNPVRLPDGRIIGWRADN